MISAEEMLSPVQRAIFNDNDNKNATGMVSIIRAPWRAVARFWANRGLPVKLILLTAIFVLVAEALIFLPSISSYRVTWLQERLTGAQLAALTSDALGYVVDTIADFIARH